VHFPLPSKLRAHGIADGFAVLEFQFSRKTLLRWGEITILDAALHVELKALIHSFE
jgi:hypothetical protein